MFIIITVPIFIIIITINIIAFITVIMKTGKVREYISSYILLIGPKCTSNGLVLSFLLSQSQRAGYNDAPQNTYKVIILSARMLFHDCFWAYDPSVKFHVGGKSDCSLLALRGFEFPISGLLAHYVTRWASDWVNGIIELSHQQTRWCLTKVK